MNIHFLQHVPFEGLANLERWVKEQKHSISGTFLYEQANFPSVTDIDMLIVLGGPMGVYDEEKYSWLAAEKQFIQEAIERNKFVLGICLGAQLIAEVLGAKVYQNKQKEIGWFPVELTKEGMESPLFQNIPNRFTAFHWHGDTFDLPTGASHIARSEGCLNQAFTYGNHVVGLQFHLESTGASIENLIQHCPEDLQKGKYVQSEAEMRNQEGHINANTQLMYTLLSNMTSVRKR